MYDTGVHCQAINV